MKSNILLFALLVLLSVALVSAQKSLQDQIPQPRVFDDQYESQHDPFKKRNPHQQKKKHRREGATQFPTRQEAEQQWGIYKPFDEKNDDYMEDRKSRNKKDYESINKLLIWGMIAGTIFLAIVLAKTCMKKRGRRELRRVNMVSPQLRVMNHLMRQQQPQQQNYYIPQQQTQPVVESSSNSLDQKIKQTEIQLMKLRQLQQEQLRKDFQRKKLQQQRIQMINMQRQQQANQYNQQPRNNAHLRYGPAIYNAQQQPVSYGQSPYIYVQSQNQISREQPFQVKGIEQIPRKRVNSFKTENSQRPIMNQIQMKYRNGIPVGKPVKTHDNDSSFASDYPQV